MKSKRGTLPAALCTLCTQRGATVELYSKAPSLTHSHLPTGLSPSSSKSTKTQVYSLAEW